MGMRSAEDLAQEVEQLREALRGRDATLVIQTKEAKQMREDLELLKLKYQALREVLKAHVKYLDLTI